MGDHQIRVLARRLAVLEQQIRLRKQPSLAYSSIDDGALMATDADGNTTMVIGVQHDGTNGAAPIVGPTPPQPTLPLVTPAAGGLRVYWDGTFADGSVAPMDFARVVAYAVPSSVYTGPNPLDQTRIVGAFTSATGGEITAGLAPEEHAVYLVCWSQAGKFSPASDVALGSPSVVVDQDAIDAVQAAADAAEEKATQAAADASQAAQDAAAADQKADQASQDAAAAAGLASAAAKVLIQSATPTAEYQASTTLWIDTTDGANTPKRWDGTAWVAVTDKAATDAAQAAASAAQDAAAADAKAAAAAAAAQAAHDAADAAEALAGTKSTVYRQPTSPWPDGDTGHDDDAGDMWVNTSPGPGPLMDVLSVSVSGGVATVRTSTDHDLAAGNLLDIHGAMVDRFGATLPQDWYGAWTVSTVPTDDTVTFPIALGDMAETNVTGGVAQGLDVKPLNVPYIWDSGARAWQNVQDSGAEAAASLQNDVKATQIDLAGLSVTASDAYRTAYTADGRVAISDYEPTPDDVEGKQDGSLWITRTRDRNNECANPSFTASAAFWSATEATMTQVSVSPDPDGLSGKSARILNSANLALHTARITNAITVTGAEQITVSGFMKAESTAIAGAYAILEFWDASTLLESHVSDVAVALNSTDWGRAYVSAQAPAGTTRAFAAFATPAAATGVAWLLDDVLIERTARLGRYFDGDSDGGAWTGADGLSVSHLDGGAIIRLFNLEDGSWQEKFWTADTISSVDVKTLRSNKDYVRPTGLGDAFDGALLADRTLAQDKLYAPTITCSEAIPAGALVNVVNVGGAFMIRQAKAVPGYDAHGFVLQAGAIGAALPVYSSGHNALLTGLVPGKLFLSSTPGQVAPTPPTGAGTLVQHVGSAVNSKTLNFAAGRAVTIT